MDIKSIFLAIVILISFQSNSQNNLMVSELKPKLVEFLIKNKDIGEFEMKNYNNGNSIFILGLEKDYSSNGKLVDGIYFFGQTRNHSRSYMMMIKNSNYEILDISTRLNLDKSLKNLIDFCEQKRYCVEITNEYVTRMIRIFYNKNLTWGQGWDRNCESGVKDIKELP